MCDKNFLVVPYWAHEALRRAKLDGQCIVDFAQVRRVFATSDLAELLAIQDTLGDLVGDSRGGNWWGNGLLSEWRRTACGEDQAFLTNTVCALSALQSTKDSARSRLYSPESRRDRDEHAFITYDIAPTAGAIVVYPGRFVLGQSGELQSAVLEAILKVLYVYNTYTEVARTPWFRQFLLTLSPQASAA